MYICMCRFLAWGCASADFLAYILFTRNWQAHCYVVTPTNILLCCTPTNTLLCLHTNIHTVMLAQQITVMLWHQHTVMLIHQHSYCYVATPTNIKVKLLRAFIFLVTTYVCASWKIWLSIKKRITDHETEFMTPLIHSPGHLRTC